MGFKNLVAKLDDVMNRREKGKSLKRKKLEKLEDALEKKRVEYRKRLDDASSSSEVPDQTDLRLRVVEAQLAKLRELMES